MLAGIVKWFDSEKGFGVVGTPDGKEFFLHIRNFKGQQEKIETGLAVLFLERNDEKKNRVSAVNCRLAGRAEDWPVICQFIGKPDTVGIQKFRLTQSHSLVSQGMLQIARGKSPEELETIILDYFDEQLDAKDFISYCERIEACLGKTFEPESSKQLLDQIFADFGANLNPEILFRIWKTHKFRFIGREEGADFEIPEDVCNQFKDEIGIEELKRIKGFSYGSSFNRSVIKEKLKGISDFGLAEIQALYLLVQVIDDESERGELTERLNKQRVAAANAMIKQKVAELPDIASENEYRQYKRLESLIPVDMSDEERIQLRGELNTIIIARSIDSFHTRLWLDGLIDEIPFEQIEQSIVDSRYDQNSRISILLKLSRDKQFELLKRFALRTGVENAFAVLAEFVRKVDQVAYGFTISASLFDDEFWRNKKSEELVLLFREHVNATTSDTERFNLFFEGLVPDLPLDTIRQHSKTLTEEQLRVVCNRWQSDGVFLSELLSKKLLVSDSKHYAWIYRLAAKFLDNYLFQQFDLNCHSELTEEDYFQLWQSGQGKIFPEATIAGFLKTDQDPYSKTDQCLRLGIMSSEQITDLLFKELIASPVISDRIIFYRLLNHIKYLIKLDEGNVQRIEQIGNSFYQLILWYLGKNDAHDFELLKSKFIYFSPEDQAMLLRKLFYLKSTGVFDWTLGQLAELTRFDLDLYNLSKEFNPGIPVDISTDVVVQALLSFSKERKFLMEGEMLKVVLHDLSNEKTAKFQLKHYFEKCAGRKIGDFNFRNKAGTITKKSFGVNQFYYAIQFGYNENLVEEVKKLPGRKWNAEEKLWGVPSQHEAEVKDFAARNRLFLDFEGGVKTNNKHFAEFKRDAIPNGIEYCEGRLANIPHKFFGKEFWWCANQECFQNCESIHKPEEWQQYTLLDFCKILQLDTDEVIRTGDTISNGLYNQFIGRVNRFNRLMEHLYCKDCNEVLYPVDTSHFAAYTVVRFHCVNSACSNNTEVYLNHCLNGQCNKIIDSRISKRCPNGLFICDHCGSCCSHAMMKRRLDNLMLTGGSVPSDLRHNVAHLTGHLERAEYFCHRDGHQMTEGSPDVFRCSHCNTTYDTTSYKIKRPHRNRTFDPGQSTKQDTNDFDNDDILFSF